MCPPLFFHYLSPAPKLLVWPRGMEKAFNGITEGRNRAGEHARLRGLFVSKDICKLSKIMESQNYGLGRDL